MRFGELRSLADGPFGIAVTCEKQFGGGAGGGFDQANLRFGKGGVCEREPGVEPERILKGGDCIVRILQGARAKQIDSAEILLKGFLAGGNRLSGSDTRSKD